MKFITTRGILLCLTLLNTVVSGHAQNMDASINPERMVPATPLTERGGLPNVAAKLSSGENVSVVFLGGSITEGGRENGYVAQVGRWLQAQYPQAKITVTNAGIGGTDSEYGSKRLDRDVLRYSPDLLIVEFSVNDRGKDNRRYMETIVRKAWMRNPRTDIVFMHHVKDEYLPAFKAGYFPFAAAWHEKVADFYAIPTIGTGTVGAAKINGGTMTMEEFFFDGVHPKPAGYAVYTEAIINGLKTLLKTGSPAPRVLTETLTKDLVVYPQRKVALPQPQPVALNDAAGKPAVTTYELPRIGTHWLDNAQYQVDGKTVWQLSYQAPPNVKKLDASVGTNRASYNRGVEYFSPGEYFTAAKPRASALAEGLNGGSSLGAKEETFAVLSFIAPATGRYRFVCKSGGIRLWSHHKEIALNVVHFTSAENLGKSLFFHKTTVEEKANFNFDVPVRLQAGDEVAFVVDTNASGGGGGAYWQDVSIRVGYFGNE